MQARTDRGRLCPAGAANETGAAEREARKAGTRTICLTWRWESLNVSSEISKTAFVVES